MADDVVARAKYAREWGDWGNLHEELLAEVVRLRGCPHDSWSGDGTGRWRCDECGADQGSQEVGEIRRQLIAATAESERLRGALERVEKLAEQWAGSIDHSGLIDPTERAFGRRLRDVLRGDQ